MKYTENYGFDKPERTDFVDVEHFNTNAEMLDKILCPEYSEEKEVTELKSGEKLAVGFGKIATAVKHIISHIKDATIHFTAKEREKLNGIAEGANKYTHPTTSGNKHIPSGGSSGQILRWSADGTAVWGNDNNTTYSNATTSASGLMSSADKTKLNGIAAGANKTTIAANLTTTTAGYALDATMGKKLSETIEEQINRLLILIGNLYGLTGTFADIAVVTYSASSNIGTELGSAVYGACMTETDAKNNVGKEVLIFFTNGAIGKTTIVNVSGFHILDADITWLTEATVPRVNKTNIQNGTITLSSSSASSTGYAVTPGYGYGCILEMSKSKNFATKYLIIG